LSAVPVLGVSVLVRRQDEVLLVRRGQFPFKDAWALPGGKVAAGERLVEAAVREVREETGITAVDLTQIDVAEVIGRSDNASVTSHHVIIVFAGRAAEETAPVASGDAAEARWVPLAETPRLLLTSDTARILLKRNGPASS
jgi:8-oxo-dGTP diphosphatase